MRCGWWFRVTRRRGQFLQEYQLSMIEGALEMMMMNLEFKNHKWTEGEQALLEQAFEILHRHEED